MATQGFPPRGNTGRARLSLSGMGRTLHQRIESKRSSLAALKFSATSTARSLPIILRARSSAESRLRSRREVSVENMSKALAAAPHAAPPLNGEPFVNDWPFARQAEVNLLFKKAPRFNLLLIGEDTRVSKILETILPTLRGPITVWVPGSELVLPPLAQTGTLLLRGVGALELGDQYRLHEWMERVQGRIQRTQIVSTSETPLLPLVDAGVFLDRLYYCLNTVYIDLSA